MVLFLYRLREVQCRFWVAQVGSRVEGTKKLPGHKNTENSKFADRTVAKAGLASHLRGSISLTFGPKI